MRGGDPPTTMSVCAAIKPNGKRCGGRVFGDSSYCWHHDPKYADKRSRIAKRAGRARREVPTAAAIAARVSETLRKLEDGEMEAREAAVMFQGFNVLRSVTRLDFDMKHADYEERLRNIEEQLFQRRQPIRRYR
jgi:hypothetical protein